MVTIELAGSLGSKAVGAAAGFAGGYMQGKENKARAERETKAMEMAERRLELAEMAAATQQQTTARLTSEREARITQQDLERQGVGTQAGIRKAQEGLTRGAVQSASPTLGGVAAAGATAGAAQAQAKEQNRALDAVFEGLDPATRDRVLKEGKRAQQEKAFEDMARMFLKKIRMLDRAEDVMPKHQDALGPLGEMVEQVIEGGLSATPQGQQILAKAEKQLDALQQESIDDEMRRFGADTIEQTMMTMAAGNPFLTRTAKGIALANRNGHIKTAEEAMGAWLTEWSPGAFAEGQGVAAARRVREQTEARRAQVVSRLTVTDKYGEAVKLPTRAQVDEAMALIAVDDQEAQIGAAPAGMTPEVPVEAPTGGGAAEANQAAVEAAKGPPGEAAVPAEQQAPLTYMDLDEKQRGALDQAIAAGARPEELGIQIDQVPMPVLMRWAKLQKEGKVPEPAAGTEFGEGELDFIHSGDDPRLTGKKKAKKKVRKVGSTGSR